MREKWIFYNNRKTLYGFVTTLFVLLLLKHYKDEVERPIQTKDPLKRSNFFDCFQRENAGHTSALNDQSCLSNYEKSCLLQRVPPLWETSFLHIRSCFSCCVQFWMSSTNLSENEAFWLKASAEKAEWMFSEPFTDWRFQESLLPHSTGEILYGQLSISLIADVNVFPVGRYSRSKQVKIVQSRANLQNLHRPVVLFSGCADCVLDLLKWMQRNIPHNKVVLFTRDDKEIGKRELSQWIKFINAQYHLSLGSKWFIMNSNLRHSDMLKHNIDTFPLGVKFPVGYIAALEKEILKPQLVREGIQTRHKLLTCSSMKFSYQERINMRNALEKKGFDCHEGESYKKNMRGSIKRQKAASRKLQDKYVEVLSQSYFFASPEGNGRDCYRHIEGIVAGSIMLTRKFKEQDSSKFEGLPVLQLPSWKDASMESLQDFQKELYTNSKILDLKRAFFPWWLGQIIT